MLRSTLIVQLFTFVLDAQGADAMSAMEVFPEEFAPRVHHSEKPPRADFPWQGASADLTDSIRFLAERHLVDITPDGRVVPPHATSSTAVMDWFSPEERDEGLGFAPLLQWTSDGVRLPGESEPHDFEVPRAEA